MLKLNYVVIPITNWVELLLIHQNRQEDPMWIKQMLLYSLVGDMHLIITFDNI